MEDVPDVLKRNASEAEKKKYADLKEEKKRITAEV